MSNDVAHSEVYRGFKIDIVYDTDPMNPRTENENLGHMICFHGRHSLGDTHSYKAPSDLIEDLTGSEPEGDLNGAIGDGSAHRIVWEPLYLYDHSGLTMRTTPFTCPWDSGQVGIIYITYDEIQKDIGVEFTGEGPWVPSKEIIEQYEKLLKGEVEEYDNYLSGSCYGFRIYGPDLDHADASTDDDEHWLEDEEDSCYGFLCSYDGYVLENAKETVDGLIDEG